MINDSPMANLAKLITQKRKELKITQSHLAKITGVNESYISRLEKRGHFHSIRVDFAILLAKAFGMNLLELCRRIGYEV